MRREQGYVLVAVLWGTALLALLAAGLVKDSRTDLMLARNLAERAKAEALADAGVDLAVAGLMHPDPEHRWSTAGSRHSQRLGEGEVRVMVQDEAGKIDLNLASAGLLGQLFATLGLPEDEGAGLAAAVVDWRDPDHDRGPGGAEDADYQRAGLAWQAKDAPFDDLSELRLVLGMTDRLAEEALPALTLGAQRGLPDLTVAGPQVRAVLAPQETAPPLVMPPASNAGRVVTILSDAHTDGGGQARRTALVRLTGEAAKPYVVYGWD